MKYLRIWLRALRMQNIVLVEGNWARPPVLREFIGMLEEIDANLWLVDRLPHDEFFDDLLAAIGAIRATSDRLPIGTAPTGTNTVDFPVVPLDDVASFLSDCRSLLTPDDARQVETLFRAVASDVRTATGDGDQQVAAVLRQRFDSVASTGGVITIGRAAQAGAFGTEMTVEVNIDVLDDAATSIASASQASTWASLRAYRQPYRPATAALVARGVGVREAAAVRIGAVHPEGRSVAIRSGRLVIPAQAQPFLRAMLYERELDGAGLSEPLLTRHGQPVSERSLAQAIADLSVDLGLRLVPGRVPRRLADDVAWLKERGVLVGAA